MTITNFVDFGHFYIGYSKELYFFSSLCGGWIKSNQTINETIHAMMPMSLKKTWSDRQNL